MKSLYTNSISLKLVSACIILILASACVKETIDLKHISNTVDWNPKYAIPLAYGSLSIKDIVNALDSTGVMKEYPDGLLYINYHDRILSQTIDSIITIPNQQFQELFYGSALPAFPPTDSLRYQRNSTYNFNFNNGAEIDSVNFKGGTLVFHVSSEFKHLGRITITMTTLTKNGQPLQFNMPINRSDGTFSDSIVRSLNGYKLAFNATNKIPLSYEVAFKNSMQPILATQKISINIDVRKPSFKSIFGYFASYPVIDDYVSKTKIDVYENVIATNAKIADPRINIIYSNSFGIPVRLQLTNTHTYSDINGTQPLTLNPSINPINIKYPNISQIGTTTRDTIRINKTNSSIVSAFNTAPQQFIANVTATTNPAGKSFNFALDTSRLNVDMEVELPMDLQASNYNRMDTLDFDVSDAVPDYDIVNKIAIYATFTNAIPCDLNLQVYLADENYAVVDSLFTVADQPIIKSGEIDSNGKVTKPTTKINQFIYDNKRAKKLKNVKFALLRGNVSTAGNGLTSVKFYSNYVLSLALGVQVDLKITSLKQLQ
jgi:hypothetical protein